MPLPKFHYEIEYARFFDYPQPPRRGAEHGRLQPLPVHTLRNKRGCWLPSSPSASLHLFTDGENSANLILAVSIHQRVHEKHFASRLNFSWPQMACVSQSSIRGSRVIFASYNDSTGQMQKFAMGFSNSSESQTFINLVKDHLRDMGNYKSPLQLQDDFITTSNEGHYRGIAAVEVKQGSPAGNETFSKSYPIQALLDHKVQCKFSEESISLGGDATELWDLPNEEADLISQFVKDTSGSTFLDMLMKLDGVIYEMGGDMTLEAL